MTGKVLITQGTRPFAQRVAKLLPAQQTVLFCAADEMPDVLLRAGNYFKAPRADTPAYVHEMLKVCLDNEIGTLIPLGENELYLMAGARPLFLEYGIAVWIPEAVDLAELAIIANPPRQLPLLVLYNGVAIAGDHESERYDALSGIFTRSDSGDELALCCIAD